MIPVIPVMMVIGIAFLALRNKRTAKKEVPVFKATIPVKMSPLVKLSKARVSGVIPPADLIDDAICEAVDNDQIPLALDLVSHYYPDLNTASETASEAQDPPAVEESGNNEDPEIEIIGPSPIDGFTDAEWDSIMETARET